MTRTWEDIFKERGSWGKYPGESLIRFMAINFPAIDRRPYQRILEIGCGPGANLWFLAREGFATFGIDGSPTAISLAKSFLARENLLADLSVGDIANLPYDDLSFDAVIDIECLYANDRKHAEQAVNEIARVLKPGGLLFSRTFSDVMYLGKTRQKLDRLTFDEISDGPLAGMGLVRLSDRKSIEEMYGATLDILSIDNLSYTRDNGAVTVSEWLIVAVRS